jgi:hypothetical protein
LRESNLDFDAMIIFVLARCHIFVCSCFSVICRCRKVDRVRGQEGLKNSMVIGFVFNGLPRIEHFLESALIWLAPTEVELAEMVTESLDELDGHT